MILAATAQSAHAQSADADGVLEQITVTAQKRVEDSQTVPIAISALSANQLANQGITNVVDIGAQVPNLYITLPYGDAAPYFSLRGISALDYSLNQSAPIALYVDEVYKGLSTFTSLQIFDIERAEVLRGPQGTLFGKNATGGAVSFHTQRPDLQDGFTGYLSAGVGDYDRRAASGAVNIPMVSNVLAGRVAFTYAKDDGFVKNRTPGFEEQGSTDDWAARLSLAFEPVETLSLLLRYTRSRTTPDGGFASLADDIGPGGFMGLGYDRTGLDYLENETDGQNFYRVENDSVALTATWDVSDGATLTSVSAYDEGSSFYHEDADITPFNIMTFDYGSDAEAYSQDLRIASAGAGPLTWLVGAYYYRDQVRALISYRFLFEFAADTDADGTVDCIEDDIDGNPATVDPGDFFTGCAYTNHLQQTRESLALYTQESLELAENLTLTVGLRYTRDTNQLDSYRSDLTVLNPVSGIEEAAFPIFVEPPASATRRVNDNFSGKLGLAYQITAKTMLYGTLSRGYRGASFNGAALFDQNDVQAIDPERLDAAEIGVKTQTCGDRLRINAAVFYYDYKNQQFLTSDGVRPLLVGADSKLWGGEIEVTAKPVSAIELRLGGSYLDSRFNDGELVDGVDVGGNQLITAPEWTFSGAIDWSLIESDAGTLSIHGTSHYTGKQFYDAHNQPLVSQEGYLLHDARLTFRTANEALAVSAWIKNIADERYTTNRLDVIDPFNYIYGRYGRPREWGVEATYKF